MGFLKIFLKKNHLKTLLTKNENNTKRENWYANLKRQHNCTEMLFHTEAQGDIQVHVNIREPKKITYVGYPSFL